jgi:hypothetical protein
MARHGRRIFAERRRTGVSLPEVIACPVNAVLYKGWRIEPTSYLSLGNGWSPDVRIFHEEGGQIVERHFFPKKPLFFPTKEAADQYALEMGKTAVDNQ